MQGMLPRTLSIVKKKKDILLNLHLFIFWKTDSYRLHTNSCKSLVHIPIWTRATGFKEIWSGLCRSFQSETRPLLTNLRALAITRQRSPARTPSCVATRTAELGSICIHSSASIKKALRSSVIVPNIMSLNTVDF